MDFIKSHISAILITLILAVFFLPVGYCWFNGAGDYVNGREADISPIEYKGSLYFKSGHIFDYDEIQELGYIMDRNNILDILMSPMDAGTLNRIEGDEQHLCVIHNQSGSYSREDVFENREYTDRIFAEYENFELLYYDEDAEFYMGSIDFPKTTAVSLEQEFGDIAYNEKDFVNAKTYYVYVKPKVRDINNVKEDSFLYIGTIFSDGGKYYYGNMNNQITGENAERIKAVIG